MRSIIRPGTRAAILALPLLILLPGPLPAQPLQPAAATTDAQAADVADPPTRVGRLARMTGQVSYRLPREDTWQQAVQNIPITEGNAIYAAPGARAVLEVGQSRIALEGGTDLQMAALDDAVFAATLPRGAAYVVMAGLAPQEIAQIVTPEAGVTLATEGRYLIEVPAEGPGRVAVLEGEALLATASGELRLTSGQAAILTPGAEPRIEQAGPGSPLVAWADGALPRQRVAIPAAAQGMTGISELAGHGTWANAPDYGQVWYPNVQQGWAPYRDGSWQWVDPWGWTWVDAQPWGYAPSHYGRWVQVGSRWAWAPVVAAVVNALAPRPVWSPANVRFFGGGPRDRGYAPVGWVPLAPREAYYPWYRASPRYVEQVNARYVTDVREVTTIWVRDRGRGPREPIDQYRNRRWATVVPAEAMRDSRPVRASLRRVGTEDWRRLAAIQDGPPRPGPRTRGLTAQDAQRFGIAPDRLRAPLTRQGPPADRHVALRERLPDEEQARPRDGRFNPPDRATSRPAPSSDARQGDRDEAQRAAVERQRRLMEEQRRRAVAERASRGDESRRDAVRGAAQQQGQEQQRRTADEQQRRGAEERQRHEEQQRRGAEERQQREEQQRRGAEERQQREEQQRRGAEERQQREEQRRAAEERQQREEQQRRGAEERQQREEQQRRGAEERQQREEQQRRGAEERQQREEQQRRGAEERQQREEQQRRAADQQQRQAQDQQRRAAEQQQRQAQDQQRRAAEQQQRQAQEQQRRAAEQQQRQAQDQQRRAAEQQQRQAQDQQRRAAEQQQRQAQEQQRRAAEQQQRQAQEQQRRGAEQQQRQREANRGRGRDRDEN
ncbi:hypothetical protein KPL78_02835 [Roseomonas sp. HJA6]|uniref:FecR protein domain-containing protein n=1 Tax=Roseomonas alba TaxID=2846776 RepID=A0ABS7A383_9PROT|nr:DUF6600 domain-containing protein [Neoroseomonas alba]MBW6396762.1 hypothetical protein [Neoroseomonas alba]